MGKWKTLGAGFVVAAVALSVVAVTTQSTAAANSDNPTFITGAISPLQESSAFALGSVGVTPLTLYPDAQCNRGESRSKSLAALKIPGVLTASTLAASCSLSSNGETAASRATIGQLSLFGGRVKASLLDARCTRSSDGSATVGATWGSLVFDQNYARNGSGAIVIPGVADISVNEKFLDSTFGYAEMLLVHVYPQQIGGVTVVPEQAIAISGCILDTL